MKGKQISLAIVLIAGTLLIFGSCDKVDKIKTATSQKLENTDIKQEIQNAYNKVKSTGEKVPDNVIEWATEDIKKIGDWNYKVVYLSNENTENIEAKLNEYGENRWEVIWIESNDNGKTIYMKRAAKSYLKHLPLKEVLKVIPADQGE